MLSVAPVPFVRENPAYAGIKCLKDRMLKPIGDLLEAFSQIVM